MSGKNTMQSAD